MTAALRAALRQATPPPARRVGERVAATGKVSLVARDESMDQYTFEVALTPSSRFEVHLWPGDTEWECDCDGPSEGCAHAWAATEALAAGVETIAAATEPPRIVLQLRTVDRWLHLTMAVRADGVTRPLDGGFPRGVVPDPKLMYLARLSADWAGDRVPARLYGVVLSAALTVDEVTLDGAPVKPSRVPLDLVAVVESVGVGWRLSLQDPPEVHAAWEGETALVAAEGVLRPRGYGRLTALQRHQLATPLLFDELELPRLTAEWLPALAKAVKVDRREGVPEVQAGGLRALVELYAAGPWLEVTPRLVYGDPPVAEVRGEDLMPLGGVRSLPPRSRRAERDALARMDRELGLRPGRRTRLEGERAARFVSERLSTFSGSVHGSEAAERFEVARAALEPSVSWSEGHLSVVFKGGGAVAGAARVVEAWRSGGSMVALEGGGWAPIPVDWLGEHGELVALAAVGNAARHAAPVAARLLESLGQTPPPDLRGLVDVLRDGGVPEVEPPDGLVAELRSYQVHGYRWLRFLGDQQLGAVLADDMGLGKTVQTLAALLADSGRGPSLVVAPTSVLRNWEAEAARFTPSLRAVVLHGKGRTAVDPSAWDVMITSYSLLRRDIERLEGIRFRTVVLDEAQAIKNPTSQTAAAARRLDAARRVALTGTPIENHLSELWSLFEFLNPGFFGPRARFDERFGGGDPAALGALRARIRPFVLRRLKSEVARELPPRTTTILRCPLSDQQRAAYDAVRSAAVGTTGRMQMLAAITRMRQASCDASLLPDGPEDAESGKLDVLLDGLTEVIDEGHRALVFSQWTSLLDRVERRLEAESLRWVRLDGSTRDRAGVIARFQAPDGPPVFLISLKAGGTGLNLTAADHVFHLDPWWNPAAEQQATDRAHRIGQTRPVFEWKLVSEGTLEEKILLLQDRKRELADAVLSGQDGAARLTDEDLALLLL